MLIDVDDVHEDDEEEEHKSKLKNFLFIHSFLHFTWLRQQKRETSHPKTVSHHRTLQHEKKGRESDIKWGIVEGSRTMKGDRRAKESMLS